MKGLFRRLGNAAVPVGADGREAFYAVKDGAEFVADITAPKNEEQVKLFFALRDLLCEAKDASRDGAKLWLLEVTGFVDILWYPNGSFKALPRSIREMRQDEFDQFFAKAIVKIQEVLQIERRADLLSRYFEMLDPAVRAAARGRLRKIESAPALAPDEERQVNDCQGERADEAALAGLGRGQRGR